jgi:hypothetical protein
VINLYVLNNEKLMFKLQVHNLFDKSSIQVISWTEPTTRCGCVVNGSAQPRMTFFKLGVLPSVITHYIKKICKLLFKFFIKKKNSYTFKRFDIF